MLISLVRVHGIKILHLIVYLSKFRMCEVTGFILLSETAPFQDILPITYFPGYSNHFNFITTMSFYDSILKRHTEYILAIEMLALETDIFNPALMMPLIGLMYLDPALGAYTIFEAACDIRNNMVDATGNYVSRKLVNVGRFNVNLAFLRNPASMRKYENRIQFATEFIKYFERVFIEVDEMQEQVTAFLEEMSFEAWDNYVRHACIDTHTLLSLYVDVGVVNLVNSEDNVINPFMITQ